MPKDQEQRRAAVKEAAGKVKTGVGNVLHELFTAFLIVACIIAAAYLLKNTKFGAGAAGTSGSSAVSAETEYERGYRQGYEDGWKAARELTGETESQG